METGNLMILRPTHRGEREQLFDIFRDGETVRYTNFQQFTDTATLDRFLDRFLQIGRGQPLQYGPYSIYLGHSLVGLCGAQQKDLAEGSTELWYILHKDYWGKGLAKQAAGLLLEECRTNPQLKTIYAEAVRSNESSWRILEKLGFVKTEELKDGFRKGELPEDLFCYSYACQGG